MYDLLHFVATAAGGLFAGSVLYVTTTAHPTRLAMGKGFALPNFRKSLERSERINPPLHVLTLLGTIGCLILVPAPHLWVAIACLAPILPLSLVVIVPVNRALEDEALKVGSDAAIEVLQKWHGLHRVRAICGVVAFLALAAG